MLHVSFSPPDKYFDETNLMSVNNNNPNPVALNHPATPTVAPTVAPNSASSQANGSQGAGATGKTAHLDPLKISSSSSQSARGADRADEVHLSSLSSKINELQSGSPEREAFLERLRLEVASGQYQPNPKEVADKIVEDLLTKSE